MCGQDHESGIGRDLDPLGAKVELSAGLDLQTDTCTHTHTYMLVSQRRDQSDTARTHSFPCEPTYRELLCTETHTDRRMNTESLREPQPMQLPMVSRFVFLIPVIHSPLRVFNFFPSPSATQGPLSTDSGQELSARKQAYRAQSAGRLRPRAASAAHRKIRS